MSGLKRIPLELIFWITALVLLATADLQNHGEAQHFTLCPIANLGMTWCPGCGIGRSITQLFHGNFAESFAQHWFGLPALLIICRRIGVLMKMIWINNKLLNLKYKEKRYV
ncbi:DUF2752 domain-containing protein [Pedobacter heparinus]|uniref:DUF2752 domain-containing protein n=1 Tax=Pedobacter heparinus TaxID=984 RepID=UPI00293108FC|nr:DUF2752 domain-containing protein [Pedobacter heparinus]